MAQEDPFTQEDLAKMKTGLEKLHDADAQIRKAQSAGINMDAQAKRTKELRVQLTQIKQTYFPGQ